MKVCVLGGGHGCHAAAIDLLEKGHDVTWWRRDREPHARLRVGVLNVTDYRGTRAVPLGDAPGAIRLTGERGRAARCATRRGAAAGYVA